jgi:hypothetical protein
MYIDEMLVDIDKIIMIQIIIFILLVEIFNMFNTDILFLFQFFIKN